MTSRSPSSTKMERRRLYVRNRRILIFLALLGSVVAVAGWIWWLDRPLRKISALLDAEDYPGSLRLSEQFLAQQARDLRAQILKARALSGLNRHATADALFRRVALESNGFPDDPAALRAWSVSLLSLEKWPQAIAILQTLLQTFPSDTDVLYQLTVARIRLRHYESALESAQQLAAISGQEDMANVMIGTIHHDRGNRQAAVDAWEKVLKSNPSADNLQISSAEFKSMVGGDLLELGQPERAAQFLAESVQTLPNAITYALLGRACSQTNKHDEAHQAWLTALEHEDMNAIAREELANEALRNQQPQDAVDYILPLSTSSEFTSRSAYVLQRAYSQLKQVDEAAHWRERTNVLREIEKKRSTVTELLRNSTDPFWSGFLHAYQLADQGKWSSAGTIVDDLLQQRPDEPLVQSLSKAIQERGPLPSVDSLTNKQY